MISVNGSYGSILSLELRHTSRGGRRPGELMIARLLEGSRGDDFTDEVSSISGAEGHGARAGLLRALTNGSARNLSEAIQQLNSSEQNQLRERWGRSLDELISLSSERDSKIFHQGLLEVGHRLEENDQLDLASVVYSALVAGNAPRPPLTLRGGEVRGEITEGENHVSPLRLRGGQEGLLPVLARAQARLNAMNGVGDWRARLAFNLERLPTNATRWDMLFAMGGAGLVFRGVRLAATARLASSFESAFALNAAVTSTAFLSETAAFTGLGRLFGTMAGNHYDWSAEGTFNEWAGGAAMLLGLKAMGGVFGNLSERWAAGETAIARITRAVAPQAGMFSGIVLGNRLAEIGGFHPERHGDTWLVDGLTTLLEFNIAGRLQRGAGGPGLTNLEGRMEAYTRSMMSSEFAGVFHPSMVTPDGMLMSLSQSQGGDAIHGVSEIYCQMSEDAPSERPRRSSSWSWGSVIPPGLSVEGEGLEGQADALDCLSRAVKGGETEGPLHMAFQWYDHSERREILSRALQIHSAADIVRVLAARLNPNESKSERRVALSLLHMLAVERYEIFPQAKSELHRASENFSISLPAFEVWWSAKKNLENFFLVSLPDNIDTSSFIKIVHEARAELEYVGSPNPLIHELLESLPRLPEAPRNFKKYVLLSSIHLTRIIAPPADCYEEYLQTLFLFDRAVEVGEWVMAWQLLRYGQERLQARSTMEKTMRPEAFMAADLIEREKALMSRMTDLVALGSDTENPFINHDTQKHFSTLALIRMLKLQSQAPTALKNANRSEVLSRYAVELFERDVIPEWLAAIPDSQSRAGLRHYFQSISAYILGSKDTGQVHWQSLLSQISDAAVASSHPQQAYYILKGIHDLGIVPWMVFPDLLVSQMTSLEIELRRTADPVRVASLKHSKELFMAWSESQ